MLWNSMELFRGYVFRFVLVSCSILSCVDKGHVVRFQPYSNIRELVFYDRMKLV